MFNLGQHYTNSKGFRVRCICIDNPHDAGRIVMMVDDYNSKNNGKVYHLFSDGYFKRDHSPNDNDVILRTPVDATRYMNVPQRGGYSGTNPQLFNTQYDAQYACPGGYQTIKVRITEVR